MLCHWRNQNELEKTSEPEAKRLRGQSNVWPTFVAKMSSTRRNPNYLRSVFPISFMRMGAGLGRWGVSCLWCLDRLNIYTCNVLSLTHHGKRCTRRINWHVLLVKVFSHLSQVDVMLHNRVRGCSRTPSVQWWKNCFIDLLRIKTFFQTFVIRKYLDTFLSCIFFLSPLTLCTPNAVAC